MMVCSFSVVALFLSLSKAAGMSAAGMNGSANLCMSVSQHLVLLCLRVPREVGQRCLELVQTDLV